MLTESLIINGRNWSRDGLPPESMQGVALVVGDGPLVGLLPAADAVYAVNRAISTVPYADFLATLHPDPAQQWRRDSRRFGAGWPEIVADGEPADEVISYRGPFGSSGLFGLVAALVHGWRRVVLVGMPLLGIYETNLPVWEALHPVLAPFTRAIGGHPERLFGRPGEWLGPEDKPKPEQ